MFRDREKEEELIEKIAQAVVGNENMKDIAENALNLFKPISGLGPVAFMFLFPILEASSVFWRPFHDFSTLLAYDLEGGIDRLLLRISELEQEKKKIS